MRSYSKLAVIGWFITAYPRTSKALVILAALALIIGHVRLGGETMKPFTISVPAERSTPAT